MTPRMRAVLLIAVQLLIVVSIAAKYGYEGQTCPRVWARTTNIDPNLPIRGRYLWLAVEVNACGLKPGGDIHWQLPNTAAHFEEWSALLAARDGKLVAYQKPGTSMYQTVHVSTQAGLGCERAVLREGIPFFISDTAKTPYPLKRGQELWVELTVPPAGPPRAVHLAISENGKFTSLNLR
jgi:hypothetical protein